MAWFRCVDCLLRSPAPDFCCIYSLFRSPEPVASRSHQTPCLVQRIVEPLKPGYAFLLMLPGFLCECSALFTIPLLVPRLRLRCNAAPCPCAVAGPRKGRAVAALMVVHVAPTTCSLTCSCPCEQIWQDHGTGRRLVRARLCSQRERMRPGSPH